MRNVVLTPGPKKRPRRWRLLLIILGSVLLLAVGGLIGNHLLNRWATENDLQLVTAELDRIDPGWGFEEIQANRKTPPEGQNSADVILEVQSLLPKEVPSRSWMVPPSGGEIVEPAALAQQYDAWPRPNRFNARLVEGIRQEIMAADPALTRSRDLVDLSYGRFHTAWRTDHFNTVLDEIQSVRSVVFLLTIDAAHRAEEGDFPGALVSLRAAVNAARSIGDEPAMVPSLVRIATTIVAINATERIIAQGELARAGLRELQNLLEKEESENVPDFVNSLRAERALMHRMLQALEAGQITLEEAMGEKKKSSSTFVDWANSVLAVPLIRRSDAVYLRLMTEAIEATRLPVHEWAERIQELKATPIEKSAVFARLMVPATLKVLEAEQRYQAVLRCAISALAAEQFRLAKGHWPDGLEELPPVYLASPFVDPYDGKPLRVRKVPDGFIIYSIGPDGIDNEGEFDHQWPTRPGTDLVFRLWDKVQRRQPPPVDVPPDR